MKLSTAARQFVTDIIIGKRLAPNPDDGDGQDQQEEKNEQSELGQPPGPVPPLAIVHIGVLDQPFMLEGSFDTLYRTIVISGAHSSLKTSLRGDRSVSASIRRCMGNALCLA